jgi:hypothetical protein
MARQIEKQFPRYALAYLRYLAGERSTVPTPTPQPLYDGITKAEIPVVQKRVLDLVNKVDLERAKP